jgi:hypothetical protein
MLIDNDKYRSFFQSFDNPVKKLGTPATLLPIASTDRTLCSIPVEIKTLWDTGATLSFIKPKVRDQLRLRMFRTGTPVSIIGVGGLVEADFTFVSLIFANSIALEYCTAYVVDFPGNFDMVIGLDIINMGDFSVCNADNKTSFSFIIPPLPNRINYSEIANALNNQKNL